MCGICGIISPINNTEGRSTNIVEDMMNRLAHRGPDDSGIYKDKNVVLGHRRLAIIDLELGKQPMISDDGRYVLIFNGEIYNYLELRQKLTQSGVHFNTFSDTEVLLQLLIQYGEKALDQLNGMFAFVFYDTKTQEWLMARDHFGIKPLYYTLVNGNYLVFASEIKALFCHPDIRPEINKEGLQQYFTFQFCLFDQTLFKGIRKVEPGCYLQGRSSQIKRSVHYWEIDYTIDEDHTEEYFKDRLRYLLEDSARLQIRSDVLLGAHLSGGVDSSIVSALAAGALNTPLPLFHGRFSEGPEYDEFKYAQIVAKRLQGELHEIVPVEKDFVENLPRLIYALDEPLAGPGLFPQYMVSRLASEKVKVVLGGQGGDEVFGGYARYLIAYLEQALKGSILEKQEEGRHIVTLESIVPNLPLLKNYLPLMKHFFSTGFFDPMDQRYFRMIDRSPNLEDILTEDAKREINQASVFSTFQELFNHPRTKSYINRMTHFDIKTLLPALLHVEDRVSMAVSLESRVPLLDYRIVELVSSIPPKLKFQGGQTKAILKSAAGNLLPREVLDRKDKMGFPVPLEKWAQKGIVRDFICDTLFSRKSLQRGLFNQKQLRRLIDDTGVGGRQLWGMLSIELWHTQMIDG